MFTRLACGIAWCVGKPAALFLALALLPIGWLTLPLDAFNLIISVVSLILLFLLQTSQNRNDEATQAKLDELIRAQAAASNEFIAIDRRTEEEIEALREG